MAVYISHSRENSGAALKLSDELVKRGIPVWLDLRELDGGADWRDRVTVAIEDAGGLVFLIGPDNEIDRQQRFEWQQVVDQELFLDSGKPLIPIQFGNAEIPGFLGARTLIQISPGNLDDTLDYASVADEVTAFIHNPSSSMDGEKLERGRKAQAKLRERLMESLRSMREVEANQAAVRELK